MGLRQDIPYLLSKYHERLPALAHNEELFNIYEGDLLTYVLRDLRCQFSPEAFKQVQHRVAPINVLTRIIHKLSGLYGEPPVRMLVTEDGQDASDEDKELFDWYVRTLDANTILGIYNEFFNLFKASLAEPFIDPKNEYKPGLRIIPSDRFYVCGTDEVNPTRPTHLVKIMGTMSRVAPGTGQGRNKGGESYQTKIFYAYTDDEFIAFDEKGEVITEIMTRPGIAELGGRNPYGKIPGVYVNRSRHLINPVPDSDTLAMTKIIPVLLSDINFATMYQAFSILYGIDVDSANLRIAPNAFWMLKSDPQTKTEPKVGSIKPEVDSDKVVALIKTELSMWMQTRGVRPGKMGDLDAQDPSSGIAKAIDQMDTSEERKKQIPYFMHAEAALWDLVMYSMHPVWATNATYPKAGTAFTPGLRVVVRYTDQSPVSDPSQLIDDLVKKVNARLESRKGALKTLAPYMSDAEIDAKLEEIDEESEIEMPEEAPASPPMTMEPEEDDAEEDDAS